jgi:hypothetical protein
MIWHDIQAFLQGKYSFTHPRMAKLTGISGLLVILVALVIRPESDQT